MERAMCMRGTVEEEEGVLWGVDTMMRVLMSTTTMHIAMRIDSSRREGRQLIPVSNTLRVILVTSQINILQHRVIKTTLIRLEAVDTTIDTIRGMSGTIRDTIHVRITTKDRGQEAPILRFSW
jgi:hypothetical protein